MTMLDLNYHVQTIKMHSGRVCRVIKATQLLNYRTVNIKYKIIKVTRLKNLVYNNKTNLHH